MATTNDITGDEIKSKGTSQQFRDNYDAIFRKNKKELAPASEDEVDIDPENPDK